MSKPLGLGSPGLGIICLGGGEGKVGGVEIVGGDGGRGDWWQMGVWIQKKNECKIIMLPMKAYMFFVTVNSDMKDADHIHYRIL